jgi:hypothetical protein
MDPVGLFGNSAPFCLLLVSLVDQCQGLVGDLIGRKKAHLTQLFDDWAGGRIPIFLAKMINPSVPRASIRRVFAHRRASRSSRSTSQSGSDDAIVRTELSPSPRSQTSMRLGVWGAGRILSHVAPAICCIAGVGRASYTNFGKHGIRDDHFNYAGSEKFKMSYFRQEDQG